MNYVLKVAQSVSAADVMRTLADLASRHGHVVRGCLRHDGLHLEMVPAPAGVLEAIAVAAQGAAAKPAAPHWPLRLVSSRPEPRS